MAILGVLEAKLKADTKEFDKGLKQSLVVSKLFGGKVATNFARAQKSVDLLANRVKFLTTRFALGGVAAGVASAIIVVKMKEAVRLAGVQERAEVKLTAVIKATGQAAGYTAQQLYDMASEMQAITTIGDEVIITAQAVLATFKQIKGDNFERATMAALDMSAVLDTDLKSSILQIGKALNDPILGMTALTRAGVTFTKTQKEQVKNFQEFGDIVSAQKIILRELESEFGGSARALTNFFDGVLAQASNVYGDMKEEIGYIITKNEFFIDSIRTVTTMISLQTEKFKENRDEHQAYAENLSRDLLERFKAFILGSAKIYDAAAGFMGAAKDEIVGTWEYIHNSSIPAWVWEVGIVGALLVGKTGAVATVALMALLQKVQGLRTQILDELPKELQEQAAGVETTTLFQMLFAKAGDAAAKTGDSIAKAVAEWKITPEGQKYQEWVEANKKTVVAIVEVQKEGTKEVEETAKAEEGLHGWLVKSFDEMENTYAVAKKTTIEVKNTAKYVKDYQELMNQPPPMQKYSGADLFEIYDKQVEEYTARIGATWRDELHLMEENTCDFSRAGLQEFGYLQDGAIDAAESTSEAWTMAFYDIESALTDLINPMKDSFLDFEQFIKSVAQSITQDFSEQVSSGVMDMFFGSGTGSVSGNGGIIEQIISGLSGGGSLANTASSMYSAFNAKSTLGSVWGAVESWLGAGKAAGAVEAASSAVSSVPLEVAATEVAGASSFSYGTFWAALLVAVESMAQSANVSSGRNLVTLGPNKTVATDWFFGDSVFNDPLMEWLSGALHGTDSTHTSAAYASAYIAMDDWGKALSSVFAMTIADPFLDAIAGNWAAQLLDLDNKKRSYLGTNYEMDYNTNMERFEQTSKAVFKDKRDGREAFGAAFDSLASDLVRLLNNATDLMRPAFDKFGFEFQNRFDEFLQNFGSGSLDKIKLQMWVGAEDKKEFRQDFQPSIDHVNRVVRDFYKKSVDLYIEGMQQSFDEASFDAVFGILSTSMQSKVRETMAEIYASMAIQGKSIDDEFTEFNIAHDNINDLLKYVSDLHQIFESVSESIDQTLEPLSQWEEEILAVNVQVDQAILDMSKLGVSIEKLTELDNKRYTIIARIRAEEAVALAKQEEAFRGKLARAVPEANREILKGYGDQISGYQDQIRELEALTRVTQNSINTWSRLRSSVFDFNQSLVVGTNSSLDLKSQYDLSKSIFLDLNTRSKLGDQDAIASVVSAGQDFLSYSRQINPMVADYKVDLNMVTRANAAIVGVTERHLSIAETQLLNEQSQIEVLESQITVLEVQTGLLASIDEGVRALMLALAAQGEATFVDAGGTSGLYQDVIEATSTLDLIAANYERLFDRAPDAEGAAYWESQINAGLVSLGTLETFMLAAAGPGDAAVASVSDTGFSFASTAEIITAQYQNLFGRAPDAEGRAYWENRISGGLTLDGLQNALLDAAGALDLLKYDELHNQTYGHTGGVISGLRNDEGFLTVEPGEGILSRDTMASLAGSSQTHTEMLREIKSLREDNRMLLGAIAKSNKQMATTMEEQDLYGVPPERVAA